MDVPRILDAISSPADLKVLDNEELAILAREIRQEIVATTSVTGGHVASSLGAVDIIVALESLLDMPRDRVVFDVGHQAYAHKLLTGRREAFKTLRTYGGLSGFTKPSESPYDVHPSGHASDSLSIATGLAKARQLKGTDEKVVALIGDASLAGGMAFEALNYMGNEQLPLVVILNDNEMSISRNVGALMKHLGNIRANSHYREAREGLQAAMEQGGPAARGLLGFGKNMKESLKQMVIPHTMIYESLGIVCTAPIDGHNIAELRDVLSLVLEMDGPALVHVVTRTGEGRRRMWCSLSIARAWWATTDLRTTASSTWCTRAWCRTCGCSRPPTRRSLCTLCIRRWFWKAPCRCAIRAARPRVRHCRMRRKFLKWGSPARCARGATWPCSPSVAWWGKPAPLPSCCPPRASSAAWWTCAG